MAEAAKRAIRLRLIHDGKQPGPALAEALRFGLQDAKDVVHPGTPLSGEVQRFDLTLELRGDEGAAPVFSGPFAHGPPAARFLYLSWKRERENPAPWGWRIKIPLAGIAWSDIKAAEQPGHCLTATVIGRRPHTSAPIAWRVERVDEA